MKVRIRWERPSQRHILIATRDSALVSEQSRPDEFEFLFNGRRVRARADDTIATALVREGVHVFSRSLKFHRPRGFYCGSGRCISCSMRVDGVPGVRTCVTRAQPGMVVESEGGFPSTRWDMLSVLDSIFRKEFDYQHRFIRPAFMAPLYQRVVRRLASSSRVPDRPLDFPPIARKSCDVLIVGNGVSGSVAHERLRRAGVRSIDVIDRRMGWTGATPPFAFGYYETGEVATVSENGIWLIRPKALLIATGRAETGLPLPGGDLPGVMLPEAIHQLASRGIRPGERAVVVGHNELRDRVFKELHACDTELVGEYRDPRQVERVLGRKRVVGVRLTEGGSTNRLVKCDLLVTLGPMVPCVELAFQAGCELVCPDGVWSVKVDSEGRTSVPGVFACGGAIGLVRSEDRISSAEAAASGILTYLEVA
jgi:sarcosine oxidase subunit alpha